MFLSEKQKVTLQRLTGVVWLILCLAGALAAMGFLYKTADYPNWELYLQLGVMGTAFSMMAMGPLQFGQAFMLGEEPMSRRLMRGIGLLLFGISGGLLTLGVFFAVLKYPNAQVFIKGGLGTIVLSGFLMLGETLTIETPDEGAVSEYE